MKRILLVNGSPRKYGFTKKLLLSAEIGVKDAGCSSNMIDLYDYRIEPCAGCVSDDIKLCRFPCPIKDDFNSIGELLLNSHGVVIGSPIYWYAPSGKMKNFIDRLTSMENMIYHKGYSLLDGKPVGFVVAGNDTGAIMSIAYLMSVFNSMGLLIPPWALAYHHSVEDPLENEAALIDSYNVGYNVCRASKEFTNDRKWYLSVNARDIAGKIREYIGDMDRVETEERRKKFEIKQ
jgi:multimeric flavodoxin WrbA